jgi:UDP-N-acetylmuramoyl-tripeptide--D-alanyl-D-alanine ligase
MRLSEVIEATGAKPVNIHAPEAVAVTGVCIDSRVVEAGDLFVALRGNRTDGHQYLQEVFDRGAIAALVEYVPLGAEEMPLLRTPNTVHALGQLARRYRRQFDATVIDRAQCLHLPGVSGVLPLQGFGLWFVWASGVGS